MLKNSQNRFRNEKLLRPYYFSDFHFMSEQDPQINLPTLPDQLIDTQIEILTTLNFTIEDIEELRSKTDQSTKLIFLIPILGWGEQNDFFYYKGHFEYFKTQLQQLLRHFPGAQINLEFQLNCLSTLGLDQFREEYASFKAANDKGDSLQLSFSNQNAPPYLNIDSSSPEQLLATFYFATIMKRAHFPAVKLFPKALPLIKKSAQAFLKINPKRFQVSGVQDETELIKFQALIDQKTANLLKIDIAPEFLSQFFSIKDDIKCAHSDLEMLEIIQAILSLPDSIPGIIIEAGIFKGGSTVRLSLACALKKRKLRAYDSFQGLPEHNESSPNMLYPPGTYLGTKEEVIHNLKKYGNPESVELVEGWFSETFPALTEAVAMAFLDVDLASSTKECIKYIWPRLVKGGIIFSHDANFSEVNLLLHSASFWRNEFGEEVPKIERINGSQSLIKITKSL